MILRTLIHDTWIFPQKNDITSSSTLHFSTKNAPLKQPIAHIKHHNPHQHKTRAYDKVKILKK